MNARPVYVYRLDVAYPPGSLDLGWEPEGWEALDYQITTGPDAGAWDSQPFRWPAERAFLSRSGALRRVKLLRSYGATATIHRSNRVTWETPDGHC